MVGKYSGDFSARSTYFVHTHVHTRTYHICVETRRSGCLPRESGRSPAPLCVCVCAPLSLCPTLVLYVYLGRMSGTALYQILRTVFHPTYSATQTSPNHIASYCNASRTQTGDNTYTRSVPAIYTSLPRTPLCPRPPPAAALAFRSCRTQTWRRRATGWPSPSTPARAGDFGLTHYLDRFMLLVAARERFQMLVMLLVVGCQGKKAQHRW